MHLTVSEEILDYIAQSPEATTQFLLLYRHLWPAEFLELIRDGDFTRPVINLPDLAKISERFSAPPGTN